MTDMKEKLNGAENKAHELKGRAEQKRKDMRKKDGGSSAL